ncbi:MAG: ABC transporter permease [Gammaproteobacteria bacterium]
MRLLGLPGRVLLAVAALALLAPVLPLSPYTVDLGRILQGPGAGAWLGTDELGRPVLDRLLLGARVSLGVGLAVVSVSAAVGVALGLVSGYVGGWTDRIVGRVIDVFLAFPGILLAIALAAVLGPGLENAVFALAAMGWVGFARLARGQALSLRGREHVLAARALGTAHLTIMRRHLLPLMVAPITVEASFGLASVIVAEAGLSFLGLGVQPPGTSWGSMIRDGVRYMLVAPHLVLAPGLALSLVVLAANRLGDRLRDRLDVRLTARRSW